MADYADLLAAEDKKKVEVIPVSVDTPTKPHIVEKKTSTHNAPTVRNNRTDTPNDRSVKTNSSLMSELTEGVQENKRETERYSFEIYTDQKPRIDELQYLYKKRTGKKLSSSRIIREALEEYLTKTIRVLEETQKK
ncbi:MAG TPA: hypothetical protein VMR41_02520 [Patescibacteria group bacterium]|nr:hypothetical protein [Patescibacteria group bacterium]